MPGDSASNNPIRTLPETVFQSAGTGGMLDSLGSATPPLVDPLQLEVRFGFRVDGQLHELDPVEFETWQSDSDELGTWFESPPVELLVDAGVSAQRTMNLKLLLDAPVFLERNPWLGPYALTPGWLGSRLVHAPASGPRRSWASKIWEWRPAGRMSSLTLLSTAPSVDHSIEIVDWNIVDDAPSAGGATYVFINESNIDNDVDLEGLGYEVPHERSVIDFLATSPDLMEIVRDAPDHIRAVFGAEVSIALEVSVFNDTSLGEERLFIVVGTQQAPADAQAMLDELDERWWLGAMEGASGCVDVTIEFR